MLAQHLQHLGPAEFRRDVGALEQRLAQLGAREQQPVGVAVRTGPLGGHAAAAVAPECPVDFHRHDLQRASRDLVEDVLRVEGAVVVADAGMIASDDEVAAAVVLPEHRVQERLARPGVAHVERITGLDDAALREVVFDQHRDRLRAHFRRHVAPLEPSQRRVDEDAVADLERDLGEILVRAVHGISRLEGGDRAPASRLEQGAGLGGREEELRIAFGKLAAREQLHRAGEIDGTLVEDHAHARVRGVGGVEHRVALERLVDRVFLHHAHRRHRRGGARIDQGDLGTGGDGRPGHLVGRQGDRNRPEEAARQPIILAHAFPVGTAHEAVERGKAADAEHQQIAELARVEPHARHGRRAREPGQPLLALEEQRLQDLTAIRLDEIGHGASSRLSSSRTATAPWDPTEEFRGTRTTAPSPGFRTRSRSGRKPSPLWRSRSC